MELRIPLLNLEVNVGVAADAAWNQITQGVARAALDMIKALVVDRVSLKG